MRPVRLEFEGFGTFRDRTVVDFAGIDLVAFVGPTGSGKSTVIDAMTFALYGSVARYDDTRLVAPVIHQLLTEAKVRFDFELGGSSYTAVRVVRRVKSKPGAAPRATTREATLERFDEDGTSTVVAGSVSELDDEIQRLIGLDFGQFTRTIVLPQGEFAEFLKDDPGNRQKLLRRLLDIDIYARMGARARERASRAAQQVEVYEGELERLAEVTTQRLADAERKVDGLRRFGDEVGVKLAELATVDTDLTERRTAVTEIDMRLGALAGIQVDSGADAVRDEAQRARTAATEAQTKLATVRADRETASVELEAAGDRSSMERQLAVHARLTELDQDVAAAERELDEAGAAHAESVAAAAENDRVLDEATIALSEARTGADVAVWLAKLTPGQPCPVCRQDVVDVPDHVGHDALAEIERREENARKAARTVTATTAKAEGRVQSLDAEVGQRRKERADLSERWADLTPADELSAAMARAATAVEAERRTVATMREVETSVATATQRAELADQAEDGFRATFVAQRDGVASSGPPAPHGESLIEDWRALAVWATGRHGELVEDRASLGTIGKELAAAKAKLIDDITDAAGAVGIAAEPDRMTAAVAAASATAQGEVERLTEQLAHKIELSDTVGRLSEERAVHEALGRKHLSANGFERWLLAEALDDMVERATITLLTLSNGRYSLEAIDSSFSVRDHGNADERRDIRTLSGGEVFLASLALALALAESIAELAPVDSPRLESIFLDEGFGTLDLETLDVLASAIEELSASGRLVAVVTHVRDLAERMPTRFEVRKGSTTSTIERVEG